MARNLVKRIVEKKKKAAKAAAKKAKKKTAKKAKKEDKKELDTYKTVRFPLSTEKGVRLMEAENKTAHPSPEVSAACYFGEDELPDLSPGHHMRVPFVFRQLRGEAPIPFFDPVQNEESSFD